MAIEITKNSKGFIISVQCNEKNPRLCIKNKLVNKQQTLVFIGPIKVKFKYKYIYPIDKDDQRVYFFISNDIIGIWTLAYCDGSKELDYIDLEIE